MTCNLNKFHFWAWRMLCIIITRNFSILVIASNSRLFPIYVKWCYMHTSYPSFEQITHHSIIIEWCVNVLHIVKSIFNLCSVKLLRIETSCVKYLALLFSLKFLETFVVIRLLAEIKTSLISPVLISKCHPIVLFLYLVLLFTFFGEIGYYFVHHCDYSQIKSAVLTVAGKASVIVL